MGSEALRWIGWVISCLFPHLTTRATQADAAYRRYTRAKIVADLLSNASVAGERRCTTACYWLEWQLAQDRLKPWKKNY